MDMEETLRKQLSLLAAGVRVERFGINFYNSTAECVKDKNGKLLLKSLGNDEVKHEEFLVKQIHRLAPGIKVADIEPDPKYMAQIPKVFPSSSGETCFAAEDEIRTLELGIQVEKNSYKMYSEGAELTQDPELKETFERLARWEKGHQKILEENLVYLRRGGTWYGYLPILDG